MKGFTKFLSSAIVCLSLLSTQVTASELPKSIAQTDENISQIFEQSSSLPIQVAGLSDGEMQEKGGIIHLPLLALSFYAGWAVGSSANHYIGTFYTY